MTTKKLEVGKQQIRAYEMRRAGHTLEEIAKELGVSSSTVQKRLAERPHWTARGHAEAYRELENDRLEYLWSTIKDKVATGDLEAVRVAIRLSESQRKLYGVDAPVRVDAKVEHSVKPELIERMLQARAEVEAKERALLGNTYNAPPPIDAIATPLAIAPATVPAPARSVRGRVIDAEPPRDTAPAVVAPRPAPAPPMPPVLPIVPIAAPIGNRVVVSLDDLTTDDLADLIPPEDLDDDRLDAMTADEITAYLTDLAARRSA